MYHCYKLHLTVQPGGSRKTEYYVVGTLEEIQDALQADLDSPEGAYHALCYGETILLQCWEDGQKRAAIDLHPYITYTVTDRGRTQIVRFQGEGDDPVDVDFDAIEEDEHEEDEHEEDESDFFERLFEGEARAVAVIDWARVPVPTLRGAPLPPGTEVVLGRHTWAYGFHGEWDTYRP